MTPARRLRLLAAAAYFVALACYTAAMAPESDHPLILLTLIPLLALAFIYCWSEGLK
jgi:hypothetical protein